MMAFILKEEPNKERMIRIFLSKKNRMDYGRGYLFLLGCLRARVDENTEEGSPNRTTCGKEDRNRVASNMS